MAASSSTARTEFFQELKPRCITINDLAVRAPDKRAVAKQLTAVTEDLLEILQRQIRKDASVLDEKLAEYVFFPLSNILRNQQQFPVRLTEITIKCLGILIQYGWKSKISTDLSQQLLIFLTYVIGGVPGKERSETVPEETTLESVRALAALIAATGSSTPGTKALVEDKNLPALGHTVTVVLDTINKGGVADVQLEALQVLEALFTSIKDPVPLATFLPGTVSTLSRLLTPPPAWKTPRKVLMKGVIVLRAVLVSVLSDIKITKLLKKSDNTNDDVSAETDGQVFTTSWLRATADQIKLALASVLRLRAHKAEDVRAVLEKFCLALLDECHQSLSTCTPILVESAMILSTEAENQSLLTASLSPSLPDLTSIYPELVDAVKTTVYNWTTSLPRVMLSHDEDIKQQAIRNLLKGERFMSILRIESTTLTNTMAASLRDSVTALLSSSEPSTNVTELPSTELVLNSENLTRPDAVTQFTPFLMNHTLQTSTRAELLTLIAKSGSFIQHQVLTQDILQYVRESSGNMQVASYWLAFELLKSGLRSASEVDDFIDFGPGNDGSGSYEQMLQELYTFSVVALESTEQMEDGDWRLRSLALEVTTYVASRTGVDFRPELIDVLYPVATYLGSNIPQLREHAIVALNNIATFCAYNNVADLIIENADYMLNSVSLRLNTFDVSPASTQVLRMMIKLTGPRLVPFLDDVVASIFGALDNYHGYPVLAESLFAVLAEIVNQGAKSNQLLLEDDAKRSLDHRKGRPQMVEIADIEKELDKHLERKRRREEEADVETMSHPKIPWKRNKEAHERGDVAEGEEEEQEEATSGGVENKPSTRTPTYTLLTQITNLTQHYLTSPSPTLRNSLLGLLSIVCPALSLDEESFLPVVNAVWPVLVERLYDPEPYVVISACKALTALCSSAGDFLSSRIETEWSDGMARWIARTKRNATQNPGSSAGKALSNRTSATVAGLPAFEVVIPSRAMDGLQLKESIHASDLNITSGSSNGGLGEFTQARQIWVAVQELLVGIVSFVRINDDIFEQILALFGGDGLFRNEEARNALEVINSDAVWLMLHESGKVKLPSHPDDVKGIKFLELQSVHV